MPTWNNFEYLVRAVESIRDYTQEAQWRLVVVDNGSTDETPGYLRHLIQTGVPLTIIELPSNRGFVTATNAGLAEVRPGENVCLMNDDIQIVDPLWLKKLEADLQDPLIGMVVPVSNYVMWLQKAALSFQIPFKKHETNLVVYFCGLMRYDAFQKVGYLDERFGMGGNDDMDYSIRMHDAGYKLWIDREVFVLHYGSRTLLRNNDTAAYDKINQDTRKLLIEKWGEVKVSALFDLPEPLKELAE